MHKRNKFLIKNYSENNLEKKQFLKKAVCHSHHVSEIKALDP